MRATGARLAVLHVQEVGITRLGSLGLGSTDAPAALRRSVEQLRDEGVDVELVTGKAPAGGVATAILELARDAGPICSLSATVDTDRSRGRSSVASRCA